jgi:hypothetical protein
MRFLKLFMKQYEEVKMNKCDTCPNKNQLYCVKCIRKERLPTPTEYLNELLRELRWI